MAKRKKYKGYIRALVPMPAGKAARTVRGKHCRWIGGDEGNSTFQCGKKIIVHDHVNNRYYRLTGNNALYAGYQAKQYRRK